MMTSLPCGSRPGVNWPFTRTRCPTYGFRSCATLGVSRCHAPSVRLWSDDVVPAEDDDEPPVRLLEFV